MGRRGVSGGLLADVSSVARVLLPEEEAALAARARSGDADAIRDLVTANLPLALWAARRRRNRRRPFDSAVSDAVMGLFDAARKFDPTAGRFSTYAMHWMRTRLNCGASEELLVRLPAWVVDFLSRYRRLRVSLGREPESADLDLTAKRLATVRRAASIRRKGGRAAVRVMAGCGSEQMEVVVQRDGDLAAIRHTLTVAPDETTAKDEELAVLSLALPTLNRLDWRHAEVLRRRFGLGDSPRETLKQIGESWGLTRGRVRQIEREAITRLRKIMGVEVSDAMVA